jgi:SAM-dependent methyltransferase
MMESYIEESLTLTATLNQLSEVSRYNRWIYDQIESALGRRVLEVGSGTGNITEFLLAGGREVTATDVVASYRDELRGRFGGQANLEVGTFDLNRAAPPEFTARPFDTVVCLNVLEHIADDLFALSQMREALKPGGRLALLVPAHRFLHGAFDEAVGHYRRYSRRGLRDVLGRAGFEVRSLKFFNAAATLPWLVNGRLLRRAYLPEGQVSLADRLVPLLRLERLVGPPFGISLIAIAQK